MILALFFCFAKLVICLLAVLPETILFRSVRLKHPLWSHEPIPDKQYLNMGPCVAMWCSADSTKWKSQQTVGEKHGGLSDTHRVAEDHQESIRRCAQWNVRRSLLATADAAERGAESQVAHMWAGWLHHPCRLGGPMTLERGTKSQVAHKQASAVPRKNFWCCGMLRHAAACCGMLRHAAACCGMLQPALVGTYASVSS